LADTAGSYVGEETCENRVSDPKIGRKARADTVAERRTGRKNLISGPFRAVFLSRRACHKEAARPECRLESRSTTGTRLAGSDRRRPRRRRTDRRRPRRGGHTNG